MQINGIDKCSFCNSKTIKGYSLCSKCIQFYNITISDNELEGCGCDQ